jgi:hypothetical protein
MTHPVLVTVAVVLAIALCVVCAWSVNEQRNLRRRRLDDPNLVRPSDMAHAVRALARLQRAQDVHTTTVGAIEARSDDLRNVLTQVLDELAVRPAPDPIVRTLHDDGPLTIDQLTSLHGRDVANRIEPLIQNYQIARVVTTEDPGGVRYRFVPQAERPDDAGYGGRRTFWSLSRLLVMSTEVRAASDRRRCTTVPLSSGPDAELTSFERALHAQRPGSQDTSPSVMSATTLGLSLVRPGPTADRTLRGGR